MKRSHSTAELPVFRPLVPEISDDTECPTEPAPDELAPAPFAEPNAVEQAQMAFPGPYTYVPRPVAMEEGDTKPGSASSASSLREGSGEAVMTSSSPAAAHSQPHSEPAPAAGGSTTAAAGAAITHTTAGEDNPHGFPLLILAAGKGRLAEVELLLKDPDVDINQVDQKFGMTALTAATCSNKPEVVAFLLANGAKVDLVCGKFLRTALMEASGRGHVEVVKALLARRDIALDATDVDGRSALFVAVCANRSEVVECLLTAGANVNLLCGEKRRTALTEAAVRGHVEVVKTLLTCKDIALDQTDANRRNALFLAAFQNKPEVVACLMAAGAKVNFRNGDDGHTALGVAAGLGHVEVMKTLLTCKGIALNQTNSGGIGALVLAAFNNKAEVVACLLAAGASMTVADARGRTALTTAIVKKHAAVLEVLVQHGTALPGFQHVDLAQSPPDVAFAVTFADLDTDRTSPADPQDNPLGLAAPHSLDDPLAVIDDLLAVLESKQDLQQWLRAKGIRMACALPVVECLASLAGTWPVLANSGRAATVVQKRLVCAAALSRLSVLTAAGKALAHYKGAGISAAGVERLSVLATRQIEKLIAVSEQLLTTMGSAMFENLVPDCLAGTSLARQVDAENLVANLVSAGWLTPLAQAIVTSWKSALSTLEAEPLAIAAGSTMQQINQCVFDNTERKAPQIFAQAMQRALAASALLAALRTWIGDAKSAEGLDLLFQIQCDQLRQYCEQIASTG
jgi:ankyrin repeat protein